jgi:type IV pilus assembly protein PilB
LKAYGVDPAVFEGGQVCEPAGCFKCTDTGYKGRVALMEVLPVDRETRLDIMNGATSKQILAKAKTKGMLTLKDIGLRKAREGLTSIEEALAVSGGGE